MLGQVSASYQGSLEVWIDLYEAGRDTFVETVEHFANIGLAGTGGKS